MKFKLSRKVRHFFLHMQYFNQGVLYYTNTKMSDVRKKFYSAKNIFHLTEV